MLDISCTTISDDFKLFQEVINQGIDSRLEAFTKSKFEIKKEHLVNRLYMEFHESEIQILLRRLEELEEKADDQEYENIYFWITDILFSHYGWEVI
tara:strand:- start:211 stop:498 length:288 start_codon:yes stop_codon:yes gene_type:complete